MKRFAILLAAAACVLVIGSALVLVRPNPRIAEPRLVPSPSDRQMFCVTNCSQTTINSVLLGIDIRVGTGWSVYTNFPPWRPMGRDMIWRQRVIKPHEVWEPTVIGPTHNVPWRLRVGVRPEVGGLGKLRAWVRFSRRPGPLAFKPSNPFSLKEYGSFHVYDPEVVLKSEEVLPRKRPTTTRNPCWWWLDAPRKGASHSLVRLH